MKGIMYIYEIPLLKNIGYLYGSVIKGSDLTGKDDNEYILCTYMLFSEKSIEYNIDLKTLQKYNKFCPPIILHSLPKEKGNKKWKLINKISKDNYNIEIPIFKKDNKKFYFPITLQPDDDFLVVKNLNPSDWEYKKYSEVKHLGLWMHYSPDFIATKLTIKWLNINRLDLKNYFSDIEMDNTNFRLANKQVTCNL